MGRAEDDPLTLALAPPAGETDEQRTRRLRDEAEARRVSDEIDSQLREERAALRKKKKPIKVLLLGQSESGAYIVLPFFTSPTFSLIPFTRIADRDEFGTQESLQR